ncbi:MAG: enoyl-CoA hydratase/isomerase family protein [Candidatus Sericytochromatia bacterium]|nr:enoyl-CoA hydratase/isomerase family protein [Candidatus Sericytochromatia bacterium]
MADKEQETTEKKPKKKLVPVKKAKATGELPKIKEAESVKAKDTADLPKAPEAEASPAKGTGKLKQPEVPESGKVTAAAEVAAPVTAAVTAAETSSHDCGWVQLEIAGEIATAWIDQPDKKVNLLANPMLDSIEKAIDAVEGNASVKVLIFASRKSDNFIAGADLSSMIQGGFDLEAALAYGNRGRLLFQRVAEMNATTIACIHGTCLGGGTELTLACDYRVASNDPKTRIGLPEVQLGILPAWGGVSRLPRMISLPNALDMMLTGKQLKARKARSMGLVHLTPPPEKLLDVTYKLAQDVLAGKASYLDKAQPKSSLLDKALNNLAVGQNLVFKQARKNVLDKSKGFYPAPLKILETVQSSLNLPLHEAFKLEADAFENLLQRSETASLMNLFFINQELGKPPEQDGKPVKGGKVKMMGVLGAGYMGAGIAQVSNYKNIEIRLKDMNQQALLAGVKSVHQAYSKLVKRKRLSAKEAEDRMRRLTTTVDYSGFQHCDLVIEAVVERMDVKKQVFQELEQHIRPSTILASNTSALSINEMAAATARPDRFIGLHFFGPVQKMPLVEVIVGEQTSAETLATALNYVKSIGKTPVVIRKDLPGFVVNRVLALYGNEACLLLEEGADLTTIDRLMTDFGMPMGIFEVIDLAGVDVAYHTANSVVSLFEGREGFQRSSLLQKLYDDQRLGQKNGKGFYIHAGKEPIPDHRYVQELVEGLGSERREVSGEEIRDRLVLSIINEAALCLQEGLVEKPGEIDMAMLMGTGFPPFRGGPLRLVDQQGIQFIVNQLEYYAETRGARFAPCQLLKDMAAKGQKFYPLF